jgi:hypothetical protein
MLVIAPDEILAGAAADFEKRLPQAQPRLGLETLAPKEVDQTIAADALIAMNGEVGHDCACLAAPRRDLAARGIEKRETVARYQAPGKAVAIADRMTDRNRRRHAQPPLTASSRRVVALTRAYSFSRVASNFELKRRERSLTLPFVPEISVR